MVSAPAQTSASAPQTQKRSFISRLFGSASTQDPPAVAQEPDPVSAAAPSAVQSVDDFVPDDGLDKSFLEDSLPSNPKPAMNTQPSAAGPADSDSDGEGKEGNPMVAGFQDDLDPDDAELEPRASIPTKDLDLTLSSDEEGPNPSVAQDEALNPEPHLVDMDSLSLEDKPKPIHKEPLIQAQESVSSQNIEPSILSPEHNTQPLQTAEAGALADPQAQVVKQKEKSAQAESSDTDPDEPMAKQMLSFVMDDPDFESEEEVIQKVVKESFPVRDDIPDLSDDDLTSAKIPEPMKPTVLSFKSKNDSDLFGLGIEEKSIKSKDSSEEQDEKESKHSKEKKKKKKRSKEDDDKSSKKKHKHKKKERDDAGVNADEKETRKRKSRSKKTDDLEAFLAGGEDSAKREEGDYEEL